MRIRFAGKDLARRNTRLNVSLTERVPLRIQCLLLSSFYKLHGPNADSLYSRAK